MKPIYQAPSIPLGTPVASARVEVALAVYCGIGIWLATINPLFKAFSYSVPMACLMACLATRRLSMPENGLPSFILIGAGVVLAPFNSLKGLQDSWLMLMGLAPFMFGFKYRTSWNTVFWLTLLATIVMFLQGGSQKLEFDPLNSVSSFESATSFIFGILAVWAAIERKWRRVALGLFMTIITLKRIVVLAAVLAIIGLLLPKRIMNLMLRPVPMLVANIVAILCTVTYTTGGFDQLINHFFGQGSDQFGMGRQYLYQGPVHLLLQDPVRFLFYGIGPGGIYDVMRLNATAAMGRNLHNDSLKVLVEYGGLVWAAFFAAMYSNKKLDVRIMMFFTNIVLLTDNTLIYVFVLYPTALALTSITNRSKLESEPSLASKRNDAGPLHTRFAVSPPLRQ